VEVDLGKSRDMGIDAASQYSAMLDRSQARIGSRARRHQQKDGDKNGPAADLQSEAFGLIISAERTFHKPQLERIFMPLDTVVDMILSVAFSGGVRT